MPNNTECFVNRFARKKGIGNLWIQADDVGPCDESRRVLAPHKTCRKIGSLVLGTQSVFTLSWRLAARQS